MVSSTEEENKLTNSFRPRPLELASFLQHKVPVPSQTLFRIVLHLFVVLLLDARGKNHRSRDGLPLEPVRQRRSVRFEVQLFDHPLGFEKDGLEGIQESNQNRDCEKDKSRNVDGGNGFKISPFGLEMLAGRHDRYPVVLHNVPQSKPISGDWPKPIQRCISQC